MLERPETGAALLRAAADANLLDPDALSGLEGGRGALSDDPVAAAEQLVTRGFLTPFQTRQLLDGRRRGFVLGGKYRVLDLVGAGGMGQVLLCEHLLLRSLVAVKVLPANRLADADAVERFHREARAAAAVRDEHLVRAYDVDSDGDFHYLVMEYVHGVSLQQLVADRGPLTVPRAAEYVRQAAVALSRVRSAGLVHRDIKPGNLLVSAKGTVVLLDLGLARFAQAPADGLSARLPAGTVLGTADYIAPEQGASGSRADIRSDIYSLGFTLYFLLAGEPPFADGSVAQKMIWHQVRAPELRTATGPVSAGLAAVFRKMTAKDPGDRYQSPEDVVEVLSEWADPRTARPRPEELPVLCPAVRRLMAVSVQADAPSPTSEKYAPSLGKAVSAPVRGRVLALGALAAAGLAAGVVAAAGWGLFGPSAQLPSPPRPGTFTDPMTAIDENPAKPIPPELAVSRLGQQRTVLMLVKNRSRDVTGTYLYSDSDPSSPKNFTVKIPASSYPTFREAGVEDPFQFYWGGTVVVTGHVVLVKDKTAPGIIAMEPGQVRPFVAAGP